jgi:hypothetical protein
MTDGSNGDGSIDAADAIAVDVPTMSEDADAGAVMDVSDAMTEAAVDVVELDVPDAGMDVPCPPMMQACSGICVDLQANMSNCGMCGRACPVGQRCNMGVCSANCGAVGLVCCPDMLCNAGLVCVMGMCQMPVVPPPIRSGADLVSAGARLSSANFQMVSTLGQSSQHQRRMTSTNFMLTGGLVGVIGGP